MSSWNGRISVFTTAGLAIAAFVLPYIFPKMDPLAAFILMALAIALLLGALLIWLLAPKSGPTVEPAPISQVHSGTGHNIVAETVNLQRGRFELTDEILAGILSALDRSRPVALVWRNKGRGSVLAATLKSHLIQNGFQMRGEMGFGEITGVEFDQPVAVSQSGFQFGPMMLMGGMQAVALEPGAGR